MASMVKPFTIDTTTAGPPNMPLNAYRLLPVIGNRFGQGPVGTGHIFKPYLKSFD